MLGVVSGYYDAGTTGSGWDFADVMPGGSANWGGSFLGVSETSEHKEAAADLALWLAAPEQNKVAFEAAGPFPSSTEGQKLVADSTNAFFNDAPVGEIFANRSQGVVAQVKGSEDSVIQDNVFGAVLDQISQGEITTGDAAWAAGDGPAAPAGSGEQLAQHPQRGPSGDPSPEGPRPPPCTRTQNGSTMTAMSTVTPPPHLPPARIALRRQGLAVPLHLAVLHPVRADRHLPDRVHAERLAVPVASAQGPGPVRRPAELRRRAAGRAVLERVRQHDQHLPAVGGAAADLRRDHRRGARPGAARRARSGG